MVGFATNASVPKAPSHLSCGDHVRRASILLLSSSGSLAKFPPPAPHQH